MRRVNKNLIRTLLMLLALIAIFPFAYPWKNSKPLLSLNQLNLPAFPDISLPDVPLPSENTTPADQHVTVFKWPDAQGGWQFGNEPPQGVNYETVELDPNANLLPGVKAPPANAPAPEAKMQQSAPTGDGEFVFGYTPEKIEAMMEKTRQVRDSLKAHNKALEGLEK